MGDAGPPPLIDPARDALFLDFDGTLVELAARPDAIDVPDLLIDRLHRLAERLDNRLAIVSGRDIATLDSFGVGKLALAGSHGAQWRLADGSQGTTTAPAGLDDARAQFRQFAASHEGVIFEDKPLGTALHYRLAPEQQDACQSLAACLSHQWGFHIQHGHAMVELRQGGIDKGTAIRQLLEKSPFAGSRPIFAGDDVTDEAGFDAVEWAGGHGVLVGASRPSAARYRLPSVHQVNEWLSATLNR
ncbi:trehalose-phosphatase [Croceicoccus sp. F390]|uniref:Trehalose 6-phosphate phosphatase n=1 Tax=Croceicoccus esteveae TaxID=3075597 RepID=A0ABU2ZJA6_9SPHN|nr:trehalose-phosphatase [Croceicoccus sp. F390]MDT0576686.1 trehalose-phosphatase [Croceicoccus sp. F390]